MPNVVLAEVGDFIEYQFYPTNHSVVRSEFGYPCIPYEDTGVDRIGFFSGFMPVDTILPDPPSYTIRVNDTAPIFYYCSAPGSCINYGMVGVINPNGTESVAVQTQLAKNSTFMLEPGQPWPAEENNPFSSTTSSAPSSTSAPSSSSTTVAVASATTTAAAAAAASHGSSGLSGGAIAGIAIGAAAVALLAAALLFMCGRASRKRNTLPAPVPYPVSYIDSTGKHMSVMTSPYQPDPRSSAFYSRQSAVYASPSLPGYIPAHDPGMSPPLAAVRPASTALNPAGTSLNPASTSEVMSPRSPSPSDGNRSAVGAVPAYPDHHEPQIIPAHGVYEIPSEGPHELHAGSEPQQGGMLGFIRRSSISKSGGVERYG